MKSARLCEFALAVGTAVMLSAALPARAATTWYVSNDGNDAFVPTCGAKTSPCRSISKAIGLASAGDTIIVGPGIYGDLDGSGTFGDFPGEEAAEIGSGCECMIKVDKQLTISSRDGARVTVLDAAGLTQSVVHIVATGANGAIFGKPSKGFTVRRGAVNGVLTDASAQKVKVQGNRAFSDGVGFNISGNGGSTNSVTAADNIAIGNTTAGFVLSGSGNVMNGNRATRNVEGFQVSGTGHTVNKNVAIENNIGFEIDIGTGAQHPLASFTGDAAVSNATEGILVKASDSSQGAGATIAKSNIYGNGDPANDCGLFVNNGDATHKLHVTATGNYWGASTGPGANPADLAGGATCSLDAGAGIMLDTSSPAAKEFTVTEKALK